MPTIDGKRVDFDGLWRQRRAVELAGGVKVTLPDLDGLIATKRFATRPKDVEDIRLLDILKSEEGP